MSVVEEREGLEGCCLDEGGQMLWALELSRIELGGTG